MWRRVPREQYLDVGESALSQRVIPASRCIIYATKYNGLMAKGNAVNIPQPDAGTMLALRRARRGDANRLGLADHDPR